MDFEATLTLLKIIEPFIENSSVDVSSSGKSDLVIIDAKNHVGFEVFDNEIIVFYFTDHCHFEDYTSELHDGEDNYVERAKAFLLELLTYKIRHIEYFKGTSLSSEKYFIIYDDGREDACIGNTWFGLSRFINPFGRKSERSTTWLFDREKGRFTTRLPKVPAYNAIEVIDITKDCYIEIFNKANVFTYEIMEICFDDYYGLYYWVPASNIAPSGFYDTKDNAIKNALEAFQSRNNQRI